MKEPVQTEMEAAESTVMASPDQAAIQALAYDFWLARGCPIGTPEVDWFQAEEELTRRPANAASAAA
jgi:hypothetical protein